VKRTDGQILAAYLDGDRLKVIPAKRNKKMVVLPWLVERFEPGVDYHFATLRRELYDSYLLDRADGVYRRTLSPQANGENSVAEIS
jgi:hypothetical protein